MPCMVNGREVKVFDPHGGIQTERVAITPPDTEAAATAADQPIATETAVPAEIDPKAPTGETLDTTQVTTPLFSETSPAQSQ